jgi:hypothetical protein
MTKLTEEFAGQTPRLETPAIKRGTFAPFGARLRSPGSLRNEGDSDYGVTPYLLCQEIKTLIILRPLVPLTDASACGD